MRQLLSTFALLALLAGLLFPIPAALVDYLLVFNITIALLLLGSSLYINEPLKISALPSFLLLATLFRLTLNVSTTRLLLSSGDCGRVVEAFGKLVAQDNLIIGFVIFLIITFIQLIVIAKGSERVAEVSARFTLDAMPGKQMAIDADMRSGLIDFQEARKKRKELQLESRFYSALDGAIKFIKGDAIAGIIITTINIIGGFLVAVLIKDLSPSQAASHYTLLTIGDGLVSQIPALLNSVAAGIIITRVSDSDSANLSTELFTQLFKHRAVKLSIAALCLTLCFAPALPALPFMVSAVILVFFSQNRKEVKSDVFIFKSAIPALIKILIPKSVALNLSKGILNEKIEIFKDSVFRKYGLIMSNPDIDLSSDEKVHIYLRGADVTEKISNDEVAFPEKLNDLLTAVFEQNKLEFLDDMQTRKLLDNLEKTAPELIASVVPDIASVTKITSLLRDLAAEDILPLHFDLIIQSISESALTACNYRQILENLRIRLKSQISAKYAPLGKLNAYTLDPEIDLSFYRAEKTGAEFNLDFLDSIVNEIASSAEVPVLIVSKGSRKLIKECLESKKLRAEVLAYEEILEEIKVYSSGFIKAISNSFNTENNYRIN